MRRAAALTAFVLVCVPILGWAAPNDPYFPLQWGVRTIHADAVWGVAQGQGSVVAVIDTGVDATHPDLRGRVLDGRDFADGDQDPSDDNGHGTLIAGIIAASSFNGIGVSSVAPLASILPVRVLGADGTGSSSNVVDGINYAVQQGATVINLSLAQEAGGGLFGGDLLRDPSVDGAIRNAAQQGAVVVVAAGNDHGGGKPKTSYATTQPGVIVVGASTKEDKRAAYSNYGPGLDVLAPGGGSARDPSSEKGCTDSNAIVSTWWNPQTKRASYGAGCGTSMSVAFVSGLAALLRARGLTNVQAVDKIERSAIDLGAPGRDDQTGWGRVDAARALGVTLPKPPRISPSSSTAPGHVKVSGNVNGGTAPPPAAKPPAVVQRVDGAFGTIDEPSAARTWPVAVAGVLLSVAVLAHVWRLLSSDRAREVSG